MKKLLVLGLLLLGSRAEALESVYDPGVSTFTVTGVICTTGTAVAVSTNAYSFRVEAIRLVNQDTTYHAWIGHDSIVSTHSFSSAYSKTSSTPAGEKLAPGGSGVWPISWNADLNAYNVLWCKAADGAGTSSVNISVAVFGRK